MVSSMAPGSPINYGGWDDQLVPLACLLVSDRPLPLSAAVPLLDVFVELCGGVGAALSAAVICVSFLQLLVAAIKTY